MLKDYLKARIDEIEKLPSMLAIMQRDLENETFAKEMLKKERDDLLKEKENLVCIKNVCIFYIFMLL